MLIRLNDDGTGKNVLKRPDYGVVEYDDDDDWDTKRYRFWVEDGSGEMKEWSVIPY